MQKIKKRITALLLTGAFFLVIPSVRFLTEKGLSVMAAENPYGWDLITSYTTYYDTKQTGRCENIRLAAKLIDGITLQAYGEFSFNATVGKRTQEAGYKESKIIVNGEYVSGVGGGVCQVSTTLYNAAVKAGLTITEYHPHSLRPSYVAPSRDAMVSSQSDLRFVNPHPNAIYLSAKIFDGGIRVCFFGQKDGSRYELNSKIVEEISPPEPIVKEGEKEEILRSPKNGVKSELYLEKYEGERLIERKKLRVDEYRPIQGIFVKKIGNTTNKIPSNDCVFDKKML